MLCLLRNGGGLRGHRPYRLRDRQANPGCPNFVAILSSLAKGSIAAARACVTPLDLS